MRVRCLLGPAGSGKTFRCLAEARQELVRSPDGPMLLLVAPKQGTYQLEQQLLGFADLCGYTRLRIVSFEGLARLIFDYLGRPAPKMLDEEGRVMVLRGLLANRRDELKLFRASARLTGFAQQLSEVLRELQRSRLTPEMLLEFAQQLSRNQDLSLKLHDLATLLRDYLAWLQTHGLQDTDCLLAAAAEAVTAAAAERDPSLGASAFRVHNLWVDGFAEYADNELELLAAVLPLSEQATLTFCLEQGLNQSWLSHWSVVRKTLDTCQKRLRRLSAVEVFVEKLPRDRSRNRFPDSPVLQHLEQFWADPQPYPDAAAQHTGAPVSAPDASLRLALCPTPESEVTLAAREILRHVRGGGRYRDISVVVRSLQNYHTVFQRVFPRYQIPFFLDRREPVTHHPLAELTRSALRTLAFGWQHEDWFAALKSGLLTAPEKDIDRLENEALARGWRGNTWRQPIHLRDEAKSPSEQTSVRELETRLEQVRLMVVPPFEMLERALSAVQRQPTGPALATALRDFWNALDVQRRLENWVAAEAEPEQPGARDSVHETVWRQMNAWLDNLELAFPAERLALRDWLPVLEAGLANLSVGIIPPALDQVLIGAIDRSRTPDIQLAIVLGLNETVFPAPPKDPVLLNEADRRELGECSATLGSTSRLQLARESYFAYIACTRARQRLVLTCTQRDSHGSLVNPSPFLWHIRRLFPTLQLETEPRSRDWKDSQHVVELIGPFLQARQAPDSRPSTFDQLPSLAPLLAELDHLHPPPQEETMAPELAERLYGPVLRTSVSRMEQFAACPFRFFVHSGLRAEERKTFELDLKEQGTFQHDVLALFHEQLSREQKRWRDLTPAGARERVGTIVRALTSSYRDGLLEASEQTRFMARVLTELLQEFVGTLVEWMSDQYLFDPVAVELPFGESESAPAWVLDLGRDRHLALRGRIDRIDLYRNPGADQALCVVLDYKSSHKQLDSVLIANGLQLQLLSYLNVLLHWPEPRNRFGVSRLTPAGVFYINLRGQYESGPNRLAALESPEQARKRAYRHAGRFALNALPFLDARSEVRQGDQFNYRLTIKGRPSKNSKEVLAPAKFEALLASTEANLKRMGSEIFSGVVQVSPYRRNSATACDQCEYQAICRIDPWTHHFRTLLGNQKE